MSKNKIHPAAAVGLVAAAIGAIFGVMYFLSEAPMSKVPQGPNFGVEGGMNAMNTGARPKPSAANVAPKSPPMAAQKGAKSAP